MMLIEFESGGQRVQVGGQPEGCAPANGNVTGKEERWASR